MALRAFWRIRTEKLVIGAFVSPLSAPGCVPFSSCGYRPCMRQHMTTSRPPVSRPVHDNDSPESTSASSVRLDELPDGVLIIDGAGNIREANQAFLRLLERDAATIIGKRVEDLIAEEDILQL